MYDAIVIGAGNGGLMAALTLQKSGKKVKILEANSRVGGVATSFIRGRFEFEASLQSLYEYGTKDSHGSMYELFEQMGLNQRLEFVPMKESFHIFCKSLKEEYLFPFGISSFIERMEGYVSGSSSSLQQFFAIADECNAALSYFNEVHWQPNDEEVSKRFPNFVTFSSLSLKEGMDALKIPLKAQEILGCFWIKMGSPASYVSFVSYAIRISSYLTYGGWVPKHRSHSVNLAIQEEFERLGGEIQFFTRVQKVLYENGVVQGVECSDGSKFLTRHIITNASLSSFCNMLPNEIKSKNNFPLVSSRLLGAKAFCVYLGLNKSAEELGLSSYEYIIFETMQSDVEFERMQTMNFSNCIATVLNRVNPECSFSGTTLLTLTSYQFGDAFSKVVHSENYYAIKNQIAQQMISSFESATGLSILEAIEEIEIATPATFARYSSSPDGTVYGYFPRKNDDLLSRLASFSTEVMIPNVHYCGGFGERMHGYSSSYLSGASAAMKTIEDMNREEGSYEG